MKIRNLSTQQLLVNGDVVDTDELYMPVGFSATVSVGGNGLTPPDDCTYILIIDDGANGVEIFYEETPIPHIYWAAMMMCLLGGTIFALRLVQKVKIGSR